MTKIIVDPDELWENLNNSLGITMGGKAPKWHWLGALKATEHTIYEERPTIYEFKGCDNCELERPQGEWKLHGMIYYCSVCGHDYEQGGNNFCGNCGAKMKQG